MEEIPNNHLWSMKAYEKRDILHINSSWWLSHPFEKYARQVGSSPQQSE